jgi:hypothetical protein
MAGWVLTKVDGRIGTRDAASGEATNSPHNTHINIITQENAMQTVDEALNLL